MPSFLDGSYLYLTGNTDNHKNLDEFEFRPDPVANTELAALERLKIRGSGWEEGSGIYYSLKI